MSVVSVPVFNRDLSIRRAPCLSLCLLTDSIPCSCLDNQATIAQVDDEIVTIGACLLTGWPLTTLSRPLWTAFNASLCTGLGLSLASRRALSTLELWERASKLV